MHGAGKVFPECEIRSSEFKNAAVITGIHVHTC